MDEIAIYRNLFKGRDDVFAIRWEKADKSISGYTPLCINEWKSGVCNKLKKRKCKDCDNQIYTPLDNYYISKHLNGYKTYGIYPLLKDNTSFFLAADFDKKNWQEEALTYIKQCALYNLPAYIERSRSGNGSHVWIFFEDKYPAYKSRSLAVNILKDAKLIDRFDKEDSFDRLFPSQDILSGKELGNLIALPMQGESVKYNNTVFFDPENDLKPYKDQWDFLQQIQKISLSQLDSIYNKLNRINKLSKNKMSELIITLKEQLYIKKDNLPKILVNFLKDKLNFINSEYLIKKKLGLNVYGMEKYFKLIECNENSIAIPRGFLQDLINFLNKENIKFKIHNNRTKLDPIKLKSECRLYEYQKEAIETMLRSENGILVAPAGSGKTVIGVDLITRLTQPTLILVHKKQIFNQWIGRIEAFLNISKKEIGQFGANKKKIGDKITVAMVQTLNKMDDIPDISNRFGMIIVDECHHMPAKMFRNVITKFKPYYLYGLTATPERKNNDVKLIFIYLGEILHTINKNLTTSKSKVPISNNKPKVLIHNTNLDVPFKIKIDNFQILSKILIFDSDRNRQIAGDISKEIDNCLKCLVLTERKEHVEVLTYYLKSKYEILTLTGDLTEKQRREKIAQIEAGNFQILLATGQLIGEGTDFPNLDCLFLVYPFAFSGKLTQYIGRIQRGCINNNVIYDYRDIHVEYLNNMFKKRLRYYKNNFDIK